LEQLSQDLVAIDAPDGFDLSPDQRLAVSDNGQRLQHGRTEKLFGGDFRTTPNPCRKLFPSKHLHSASDLFYPKGSAIFIK
jgi:hypothetical protein